MKKFIFFVISLIALSGCCRLENLPDYIAGTYVNQPKEGTGGRYVKIFDLPYSDSFDRAAQAVVEMGGSFRFKSRKRRTILAWYFDKVFVGAIDTTKVGIYFKEIEPGKTQIDIACGNYELAKFVSDRVFARLETTK